MNDLKVKLGYTGSLKIILSQAAKFYNLGEIFQFKYIKEGYEDYNIKLKTDKGIFNFKLFANNQLGDYSKTRRGEDVVGRLVEILLAAEKKKINSPRLLKGENGFIFRGDSGMVGVLYNWIDGETFYNLHKVPDKQELESVVKQIALFNQIKLKPVYYLDIWAVTHIHELYKKVERHLSLADKKLLKPILAEYDQIPFENLPKCLVHGDITKGNVLRTPFGEPYIIDFSVTNWSYRIIEIGLIASNFMFDPDKEKSLKQRVETVSDLYQKYNRLEKIETSFVYNIALASSAMELLGSRWRQVFLNDEDEETNYWLNLGRQTIKEAFEK